MSMNLLVLSYPSSKVSAGLTNHSKSLPGSPDAIYSASLDVMREYRRLDDTIVMRLNRSDALFRDSARSGKSQRFSDSDRGSRMESGEDSETCLYIWRQLVGKYASVNHSFGILSALSLANWKSRTEIIDYCVSVVDSELAHKEAKLSTILDSSPISPANAKPTTFTPSQPQKDSWQGPSNDFYRATRRPNSLPPVTSADPEEIKRIEAAMTSEERQDFERRQREKENDVKASLWEERVKVGIVDCRTL